MPAPIPARYNVSFGLIGCYMPNSVEGPFLFDSRGAFAEFIRSEIALFDFPVSAFDQVKIQKLWKFIQHHGSSTAHFSIQYKGNEISFHGLTEHEYETELENAE